MITNSVIVTIEVFLFFSDCENDPLQSVYIGLWYVYKWACGEKKEGKGGSPENFVEKR